MRAHCLSGAFSTSSPALPCLLSVSAVAAGAICSFREWCCPTHDKPDTASVFCMYGCTLLVNTSIAAQMAKQEQKVSRAKKVACVSLLQAVQRLGGEHYQAKGE